MKSEFKSLVSTESSITSDSIFFWSPAVPDTEMRNNGIDEGIVKRLESLQIKYDCLKRDLQSLLDEKVDLITERDAYKCKVHRLNHSMAALLKSGKC